MAVLATVIGACSSERPHRPIPGADPAQGLLVIERAGCAACHEIPGVAWPRGQFGGALEGFAGRTMIAGRFPNQPDTLLQWLRDAPSLAPGTAMPTTGLTEAEARDVAAYLYTLDD